MTRIRRRQFLKTGLAAGLAALAVPAGRLLARPAAGRMPMRPLGLTGEQVSLLGLGGFHVGIDGLTDAEAIALIRTALDGGVTFLDNAREYNGGRSEERVGKALQGAWRERAFVMTKNCAHTRDGAETMRDLEASLKALRTDRIDLMLLHEVCYDNDPDWVMERGAVAAAIQARRQGKVRFIGFSGHKLPSIHLRMLALPVRWDAVMLPLGVMDHHFRSFEAGVLPELTRRRIGSIAFKTLSGFMSPMLAETGLAAADCLRYTMSLPISTLVVGMESKELLRKNLETARNFTPMSQAERDELLARSAPHAADGRYEKYKTTMDFEGPPGKLAHRYINPAKAGQ
ncbi:MAG: aldo/keto reductase [Candidatus Wallbacteria bacterium]|nr:aldo/keto reductase [Candidatus Wallbacteria bacterium]